MPRKRKPLTIDGPPISVEDRFLTPRQMASVLQVSPSTIRRRLLAGELPHVRVGSQIRFNRAEVVQALRVRNGTSSTAAAPGAVDGAVRHANGRGTPKRRRAV